MTDQPSKNLRALTAEVRSAALTMYAVGFIASGFLTSLICFVFLLGGLVWNDMTYGLVFCSIFGLIVAGSTFLLVKGTASHSGISGLTKLLLRLGRRPEEVEAEITDLLTVYEYDRTEFGDSAAKVIFSATLLARFIQKLFELFPGVKSLRKLVERMDGGGPDAA